MWIWEKRTKIKWRRNIQHVSRPCGTSQPAHDYTRSTMTAKINSRLAIYLLSGWKANVSFMPLTSSVNNSKSQGTQTPVVPSVQSLKSVKTWLVYAFTKHIIHSNTHTTTYYIHKPTKPCRHACKRAHIWWHACPDIFGTYIRILYIHTQMHFSPHQISQPHHYHPCGNQFVRGEMPLCIIHSSRIH